MTRNTGRSLNSLGSKHGTPVIPYGPRHLLTSAIAIVWVVGFFVWFQSFGFFNNPGAKRWMLWPAIPFDFLDILDPPIVEGAAPWSWFFVFQRVPFLLTAIVIWVGAWGLGSLFLRCIKLDLADCERLFFSTCLGLAIVSLTTLLLGLCGCMNRWPLSLLLVAGFIGECLLQVRRRNFDRTTDRPISSSFNVSYWGWIAFAILIPFVAIQLQGAMSPQTDFDVIEYHLGGPKEWFQMGRITRLPHNIYTNFPFLTEMLILAGMILYGDWQWGALAGQAAIAGFAPLTAIGLFAAGRRWFSAKAGAMASLVYLTSPWTYRISIIAYAEGGLACYLFAAFFAALLFREPFTTGAPLRKNGIRFALLSGIMAGSAMACKYTGLTSVVIPIGCLLLWTTIRYAHHARLQWLVIISLFFSVGVFVSVGPWLLKNAVSTGNPVYPLAYRIFGGVDRDETLDTKWRNGHAARIYPGWNERLSDVSVKLTDVVANNDWHSPLMFGLAPLSLLLWFRRRDQETGVPSGNSPQQSVIGLTWLYVAWQFAIWFLFTHHIDRFYVPMFSAVSLLAGVGASWPGFVGSGAEPVRGSNIWRWFGGTIILASILYNAEVMMYIGGFNAGRLDLVAARDVATSPRIKWLNQEFESGHLPPETKVLCVGDAGMFHARYPYIYNTVFDRSWFEILCAKPQVEGYELQDVGEIRSKFRQLGITHIDVSWSEIRRYREQGSYGYTEFVQPERFSELQRLGLLGPSIFTTGSREPDGINGQVFPVLD
jgi:hypothetical protein